MDFTGEVGDDLDVDDDGMLDNEPWSEVLDCLTLVETPDSGDLIYCETTIGPDGPFVPAQVYACVNDGMPGEFVIGEFTLGITDTPGSTNLACP
eukprot:scaffold3978_cov398-Prasinococcus_capsulatus_cf.AAC.1